MSVRETIEGAFERVDYPGDLNIIHCSCPICHHVCDYFHGTKWKSHTLESLRKQQLALSLFTPEAFRYFLPAYMTRTLDAWQDTCLIPFLITKQFLPPRSDENPQRQEHHAKLVGGFSAAQRAAIVAYLREYVASGTALVLADVQRAIALLQELDSAKQ